MCPAPNGREREIKNDPRLQKKISHLQGIDYRVPLDEAVEEEAPETEIVDAFAVETGEETTFEEEMGMGQATDILGELMDMNEQVTRALRSCFGRCSRLLASGAGLFGRCTVVTTACGVNLTHPVLPTTAGRDHLDDSALQ